MKKIKVIGLIGCLLLLCLLLLSGCYIPERVENKELQTLDTSTSTQLEFEHEFEGIKLKTNYSAGDYDIGKWQITDSKTLNLNLLVEEMPDTSEILIEHVHADVSLASKLAYFNGLPQDSMDDSYHGYSQDGIAIDKKYPYHEVFAIEGYSETFINGWQYAQTGGYISEKRLTERNLMEYGETYGNKIQVIYNLNIKHKDEKYFHTKTIKDEFYVKTTYTIPTDE